MRILNNYGIKIALKPIQTLGHIFAKPKDRVPIDGKTQAVYSIQNNSQKMSVLHTFKKNIKGLSLTFTAQSQPWLNMSAKQVIKLRGKIQKS